MLDFIESPADRSAWESLSADHVLIVAISALMQLHGFTILLILSQILVQELCVLRTVSVLTAIATAKMDSNGLII